MKPVVFLRTFSEVHDGGTTRLYAPSRPCRKRIS